MARRQDRHAVGKTGKVVWLDGRDSANLLEIGV
jgi:hypothetical protein